GVVTAVTVNGNAINVILRGLVIDGQSTGQQGIVFSNGQSLTVEDTVVKQFGSAGGNPSAGIKVTMTFGGARVMLNNVTLLNNAFNPTAGGGVIVLPPATGSAIVIVQNSKIENNAHGVLANSANGSIVMTVRDTTIANNYGDGVNATAGNVILMMLERATI